MIYREVGKTGIKVSQVCLGTLLFGAPVSEKDSILILRKAVDNGVNFIDTANIYEGYKRIIGNEGGTSEEIISKGLKNIRNKVILATKVGMPVSIKSDDQRLDKLSVRREIIKSLRRLKTDYIDFYYMHMPDKNTPIEESIDIFNQLIKEGKIRHYGISNYSIDMIKNILSICEERNYLKPVITQPPYSLLRRGIEKEELPLCLKEGISVVPYQILQGGVLTGKYKRGIKFPKNSRGTEKPQWMLLKFNNNLFDKLEALEKLAQKVNMTMTEYVTLWTLSFSGIVSVLVGVKNIGQLEDILSFSDKIFPKKDIQKVNEIFKVKDYIGDYIENRVKNIIGKF